MFIWLVEMCFIFAAQINVIFMRPLYEASILCDCIINVKKCIRMGITIFKMFIWGGVSSVIWSEITFYGSADASP